MINREYKICNRCVMDNTAENILFDDNGYCNYCNDFIEKLKRNEIRKKKLTDLINKVKDSGEGKNYDCIVGLSGGVDSSYTLVKVKELGLRPLAVHMDNGWDSEIATNNIKNLVDKLNVDLFTYVIDWDEYRNLMQAFFDADVIDIELLYDNAMLKVCYEQARKFKIKYILAGTNTSTEGMRMPPNWNWFKFDKKNIKNLAKLRNIKINSFPAIGTLDYFFYTYIYKIEWIDFLDYISEYNKFKALNILKRDYDFKPYPYKHYESVFTRFYQGYILPEKFGVDKRKLHFSNLIITNQMTREEALEKLKEIPYISEFELKKDKEYFIKKMGWNEKIFDEYISRPPKSHLIYASEKWLWDILFGNKYKTLKSFLKKLYKIIFFKK